MSTTMRDFFRRSVPRDLYFFIFEFGERFAEHGTTLTDGCGDLSKGVDLMRNIYSVYIVYLLLRFLNFLVMVYMRLTFFFGNVSVTSSDNLLGIYGIRKRIQDEAVWCCWCSCFAHR